MADTRRVANLTVSQGWKIGQGGQATWHWPNGNRREYVSLSGRYWKMHYTVNGKSNGKVSTWHMTFEEVDWEYKAVTTHGRANRPALHWEYASATDQYVCKGWKNGRPFNMQAPDDVVQEVITQETPISADPLLAELPLGAYMSDADFQNATTTQVTRTVTVRNDAGRFLDRVTNLYVGKPLTWFGATIAGPVWNNYA